MIAKTVGLFFITAIAEIVGCYLPYLWLRGRAEAWVLMPAAAALVAFVWLLTLHPAAAGRPPADRAVARPAPPANPLAGAADHLDDRDLRAAGIREYDGHGLRPLVLGLGCPGARRGRQAER